jgi:phosphoribosylformylglycinamidine synthase I
MKAAVIVFPGSNCDRDVTVAIEQASGQAPAMVWHRDTELPAADLIVLPGGFSYGDYLRAGAMAAHSPILREVVARARKGATVVGICNGFQVLIEAGLLPGALLRNAGLTFVCRDVWLRVDNSETSFTRGYAAAQVVRIPVAHQEGNYRAGADTLARLEGDGRVAFRYCGADGSVADAHNPNGSANQIAGVLNEAGNVLGLMPHPERVADGRLGGTDGRPFFTGLAAALAA